MTLGAEQRKYQRIVDPCHRLFTIPARKAARGLRQLKPQERAPESSTNRPCRSKRIASSKTACAACSPSFACPTAAARERPSRTESMAAGNQSPTDEHTPSPAAIHCGSPHAARARCTNTAAVEDRRRLPQVDSRRKNATSQSESQARWSPQQNTGSA